MTDKEIVSQLITKYGSYILPVEILPKEYCPGEISQVRAIYLGCDPSNVHSTELPYVFALESGLKVFNSFIKSHKEQLELIGLDWNCVYSQNLCRNYFNMETSNNSVWKIIAKEFWIDSLKVELSQFEDNIPVLLTSNFIYDVLMLEKKYKPMEYYECKQPIPIQPHYNKLGRPLIPLYRNRMRIDYHLTNPAWASYRNQIVKILNNNMYGNR
jgi:hypothetical protein